MSKFIELTIVLPNGEKTKRCFNSLYIFGVYDEKDGTKVCFYDIDEEVLVEESYSEIVNFLKS